MDGKIKAIKIMAIIMTVLFGLVCVGSVALSIYEGIGLFDSSILMSVLIVAICVLQLWKMYFEEKL